MKKTIYLPQYDKSAEAQIVGKKITVRYEGNESFPKNLRINDQYFVVVDGEEKIMVLTRKPMGSWQFTLQ